jgi:starch synthase
MMTKEWPPDVYGGAGVHVVNLVEHLRPLADVTVQCFGSTRSDAQAFNVPANLASANPALATLGVDLLMADNAQNFDVVHSHTWYANLAGHLAGLLHATPHVITAHSLEPMRPWKAEQLGGGYRVSSWVERTTYENAQAIIAVSAGMRADVLSAYDTVDPGRVFVVHNGINTDDYRPDTDTDLLEPLGLPSDRPYVLFVGRITRQKGINHLLAAAQLFEPGVTLVLCASSPDTEQIGIETERAVDELKRRRGDDSVIWIQQQVDRPTVRQLLTHALVFACPSVYEPLGIVNLEAMACETAVVASAVGGIPEVVAAGVTGLLVPYDSDDTRAFEHDFASAVNTLIAQPDTAQRMGVAGRQRAISNFSWNAIAQQTVEVYQTALTT